MPRSKARPPSSSGLRNLTTKALKLVEGIVSTAVTAVIVEERKNIHSELLYYWKKVRGTWYKFDRETHKPVKKASKKGSTGKKKKKTYRKART